MGRGAKEIFSKEVIKTANKHMKRRWPSGNANQNGSETSPTTCENVCHGEDKRSQVLVRMWWKGNPVHCRCACSLARPLWEAKQSFLKKFQIDRPYDPATLLLRIYPKKMKRGFWQDICTRMLFTLLTIAKILLFSG